MFCDSLFIYCIFPCYSPLSVVALNTENVISVLWLSSNVLHYLKPIEAAFQFQLHFSQSYLVLKLCWLNLGSICSYLFFSFVALKPNVCLVLLVSVDSVIYCLEKEGITNQVCEHSHLFCSFFNPKAKWWCYTFGCYNRYSFGSSNNNAGLLLLLDKTHRISNWKCVTRTHGWIWLCLTCLNSKWIR